MPRVLGVAPEATALRKKLNDKNGLCAYRAQQRFDLPPGVQLTPAKVVEALACRLICRELGLEATAADLAPSGPLSSLTKVAKQLPNTLTGTLRADADSLRNALLRDRLAQTEGPSFIAAHGDDTQSREPDEPEQRDMDLPVFAAPVQALARTSPTGRWGDNKVFINHIWREFQAEPNFPRLDLAAFKERLLKAHRGGLLRLERADLVEAMNSDDVRASETPFLTATYHFVLIERERP